MRDPGYSLARLRAALARRFGVDPRGLAALRVAVGTLLVVDLALRSRDLVIFYTDAGVLPRSALRDLYPALSGLSVHALFGSAVAQAALFAVAGVAAVALAVGYRTRLATAVSLLLLVSLHVRNPLVLNAGDSVLRRLLLWGLLLPLGSRWSVDARRRSEGATGDRERVVSLATAGLLVQVVVVYLVNGLFKLRSDLWTRGVALQYVFSLDQITVLFGDHLAGVPAVLGVVETAWMALLFAAVGLVALTGWPRGALVAAFAGAHCSMLLTMRLGIFPLISLAALIPFLPPVVWDRVERAARRVSRSVPVPAFSPPPSGPIPDPVLPRWTRRWRRRAVAVVAGGLLLFVLVWNGATLGYVDTPAVTGVDATDQYRWDMFASPRRTDGWYVVAGRTTTGQRVDALHDRPLRWDRPPDVADAYPTHRWMRYLLNLRDPRNAALRGPFAEHLCDRWAQRHDSAVRDLTVYFVAQPTRLDGPEPLERRPLHEHRCG